MNAEVIRIAWACFLGAVVGTLVAQRADPANPYLVILGFLVGGLTGYVAYSVRHILHTAKAVTAKMPQWRELRYEARMLQFHLERFFRRENLKATMEMWVGNAAIVFLIVNGVFAVINLLLSGKVFGDIIFQARSFEQVIAAPFFKSQWYFLGGTISMLSAAVLYLSLRNMKDMMDDDKYIAGAAAIVLAILSPGLVFFVPGILMIVLCLAIPVLVMYGLIKLIAGTVVFCFVVARDTFLAIHSDSRLVCATDATIGACIGYYSDNMLVGGIIGAFLGILSYKLVTVRLKLVPKPV